MNGAETERMQPTPLTSLERLCKVILPEYRLTIKESQESTQVLLSTLQRYLHGLEEHTGRTGNEASASDGDATSDAGTETEKFSIKDFKTQADAFENSDSNLQSFPQLYADLIIRGMLNFKLLRQLEVPLSDDEEASETSRDVLDSISFFDVLIFKMAKFKVKHVDSYEISASHPDEEFTYEKCRKIMEEFFNDGQIPTQDITAQFDRESETTDLVAQGFQLQERLPHGLMKVFKLAKREIEEYLEVDEEFKGTELYLNSKFFCIGRDPNEKLEDPPQGQILAMDDVTPEAELKKITPEEWALLEKNYPIPFGLIGELADVIICLAPFAHLYSSQYAFSIDGESDVKPPILRENILRSHHALTSAPNRGVGKPILYQNFSRNRKGKDDPDYDPSLPPAA